MLIGVDSVEIESAGVDKTTSQQLMTASTLNLLRFRPRFRPRFRLRSLNIRGLRTAMSLYDRLEKHAKLKNSLSQKPPFKTLCF